MTASGECAYLLRHPEIEDMTRMMGMPGFIDRRNYALILRLTHMRRWIMRRQCALLESGEAWSHKDIEVVVPAAWGHWGHEPEAQLSGSTFLGMDVVRDPKVDRFTVRVKTLV